jgi:hypothetical protein
MRLYFAFFAAVLIGGALWLLLRRVSVASSGRNTTGTIVAFESREDDGSVHYLPVVTFTDHRGNSHRFTSVAGSSEQSPPLGSSVAVRYLPQSPEQAFIVSFLHMWAAPLGMFVLGLGALLAYVRS